MFLRMDLKNEKGFCQGRMLSVRTHTWKKGEGGRAGSRSMRE